MPMTKKSASTAPDSWLFGVMGVEGGIRSGLFLDVPARSSCGLWRGFTFPYIRGRSLRVGGVPVNFSVKLLLSQSYHHLAQHLLSFDHALDHLILFSHNSYLRSYFLLFFQST